MKITIEKDPKVPNNFKVQMTEVTEGKILTIIYGLQLRVRKGSAVAGDVMYAFTEAAKAAGIEPVIESP